MPDYVSMKEHIEAAEAELKKAVESVYPIAKLTQLEAYVLGHLRILQKGCEMARSAIDQTQALAKKRQKEENPKD